MPKRPRSHILDSLERSKLHSIFEKCGWIVWDLFPDSGEDLLVRIFIDGKATQYTFFVQVKGTDSINEHIIQEGKYLSVQIDTDHLEYWKQFWEPVFLMVYDARTEIIYWEIIQDYLEVTSADISLKGSLAVHIPVTNTLDEAGLQRILARTKSRFIFFEEVMEGTKLLIEVLEKELNVKVVYTPRNGILMMFQPDLKTADLRIFSSTVSEVIAKIKKMY